MIASELHATLDAQQTLKAATECLPRTHADVHLKADFDRPLRSPPDFVAAFREEIAALVDRVTSGDSQLASPELRSTPIRQSFALSPPAVAMLQRPKRCWHLRARSMQPARWLLKTLG